MHRFFQTWLILTVIAFGLEPLPSFAVRTVTLASLDADFRPEAVLTDRDLFEINSLSVARIQQFLNEKGTLGARLFRDIDGKDKSAAEIIWRISTSYHLNPNYLLALMQKEQSLVEDPHPTQKQLDWATGFGICDDCSMDDPRLQDFRGFANQLEYAAKQHRERYLLQILGKGATVAGYAPGKLAIIDGLSIVPQNQATAMLYSYTPHINGNQNLWRIWKRWFSLTYPDGTIVKGRTSDEIYLLSRAQRRRFTNPAIAASMVDPKKIVVVEDNRLAGYTDGPDITFPNYAIVETPDRIRYLIAGKTKKQIASKNVFRKLGFNEDEVIPAHVTELAAYEDGAKITTASAYPTGILLRDAEKNYWYVEDGTRHAITHRAFLTVYFRGRPAKSVTKKTLLTYKLGTPYALHDGELVRSKSHPTVYVIENGIRLPIPSARIFEELGYHWPNVVTLPDLVLKDYSIGEPVDPHPIRTMDAEIELAAAMP